jgi:asparagine synthase (glutamine-hydrolysing)
VYGNQRCCTQSSLGNHLSQVVSEWRPQAGADYTRRQMCGIVGQARADGKLVGAELVTEMCAALEHRGPDSRGMYVTQGAGLGIQRLAIIDLASGDQPIFNEDRAVVVVLNGEIYNFQQLRGELERRGHRFRTRSDTEVIVHLYEEQGPDCIRSLHGMFGLAIWDEPRRRLVLARDRLGKKPLYYSARNGILSFASELPALMRDSSIPRDLDHQALDAYLGLRWVPSPRTAYNAIKKLPPASTLVYEHGHVEIARYWQLDYARKERFHSEAELHERIRHEIREATRKRLIADVPLGAFLSGGVDSSAVVAAMAEASATPVKTFSVGFTFEEYNELPLARITAERFGTAHEEAVVEPRAIEIVPRIVRHYGEPFADASAIPSFYVAEMTRRHVTVALNGDGGDESFGGYTRYVANAALARAQALPPRVRRAIAAAGTRIPANGRINSWPSRLRRFSYGLALDGPDRYAAYMTELNGLDRDALYSDDYRAEIGRSLLPGVITDPWRASSGPDAVDVMLDVDTQTYLVDDLLTKMDIATMAHSLEARSPLLDHQWMEFCASLPARMKVRGLQKKVALRAALRGWVPDEILDAPKRGFRVPMAEWLRNDLRDYARDVLLDSGTESRGYFNQDYVRSLLQRHQSGIEDRSQALWTLLVFELWHREFVDAGGPASAVRTGEESRAA